MLMTYKKDGNFLDERRSEYDILEAEILRGYIQLTTVK